jgi:Flp pilus assembly pilin Flp
MFSRVKRFLADEEGLVTLEWVALASGVIILAVGAASVVRTSANSAASTIGSKVVSSVNSNS